MLKIKHMEYLNELFDNANMRRLDAQEIRDCGINESIDLSKVFKNENFK